MCSIFQILYQIFKTTSFDFASAKCVSCLLNLSQQFPPALLLDAFVDEVDQHGLIIQKHGLHSID